MRHSWIAFAVICAFAFTGLTRMWAAEEKKEKSTTISGLLVDGMCAKDKKESALADHTKACCIKCADSGYVVVSGDKSYKFDENGNKLAKEYLAKEDSKTKVTVEGTLKDDGSIAVSSIAAQKEEKKG